MNIAYSAANLKKYLKFMISNEDVKNSKPAPEIYLKAIDRLGLKSEECLVIEDNHNGVQAAQAAKAQVMVIQHPNEVNYSSIKSKIALVKESVYA